MAHSLGIDVGTTNAKVVLVDSVGRIASSNRRRVVTWRAGDRAGVDRVREVDAVLLPDLRVEHTRGGRCGEDSPRTFEQ
jgi:hypothetical protein